MKRRKYTFLILLILLLGLTNLLVAQKEGIFEVGPNTKDVSDDIIVVAPCQVVAEVLCLQESYKCKSPFFNIFFIYALKEEP